MDFKSFFFGLSTAERDVFATKANSSRGLLTQVAYENKRVELGLADVIVALAGGKVPLDGIALTANARRQRAICEGPELIGAEEATQPITTEGTK